MNLGWQRVPTRAASAVIAATLCVALVFAISVRRDVDAQIVTDFNVSVTSAVAANPGEQTDVQVRVMPGTSAIAALGATVTYDPALLQIESCGALVGFGACNFDTPGEVRLQSVDAVGWTSDLDVFTMSFTRLSGLGDHPLTVSLDAAYNVAGELIAGDVVDGQIGLNPRGDVNCDSTQNILDALVIAQFSVGNRTETDSCPLADPVTTIFLGSGDMNDDNDVNILDALLIAQCSVGTATNCTW